MNNRHVIRLVPIEGEVLTPSTFVACYDFLLSDTEREFLKLCRDILNNLGCNSALLSTPWTASKVDALSPNSYINARSSGARSAVWIKEQIQFKGCRPSSDKQDFSLELLPFGASEIMHTRIPFGVMSAEAVIRELLGYCFCEYHDIPCASKPLCVYAYKNRSSVEQFCLVLRVSSGRRAESFLQWKGIPISELTKPSVQSGVSLIGSEVALRGLNSRWYTENKSKWLTELHFHGAFRGLLNNNIGNDVIEARPDGKLQFLFCDFDSFKLVKMPPLPSPEFLNAFALQCVTEVVKGSLPILEYVRVSADSSISKVISKVSSAYKRKSSLWNSYWNRARLKAHELSWKWTDLDEAFVQAFETHAFLSASCSVILSDYSVERFQQSKMWEYVPHEVE